MRRKGMTVREAAEAWVNEFNAFPQDMIATLMYYEPDKWEEVTKTGKGDDVYMYELPVDEGNPDREYSDSDHYGKIEERLEDGKYRITFGEYDAIAREDEFDVMRDSQLPMWGMMWNFGDKCDDYWLREMDWLQIMSDLGFRIYEHEDWGYFFGIDGCGYDFYEAHWCPLYRARGLQWHDSETEKGEKHHDYA